MPFFRNQDHIESLVSYLSAYLSQGQALWQDTNYEYFTEKGKEGFNEQAYEADLRKKYNAWKEQTRFWIANSLPIHYQYLFLSPLRTSLSLKDSLKNAG